MRKLFYDKHLCALCYGDIGPPAGKAGTGAGDARSPRFRPRIAPMSSKQQVVLYTRQGCHLCEDALAILIAHGFVPKTVDVDQDAALRERFNECVPVVEIDGKIRFRGRVDAVLLRRLLRDSA